MSGLGLRALWFIKTLNPKPLRYGIGDLSALAGDTHKFESRYLDGLVGPYPEKKAPPGVGGGGGCFGV